jgi:DNA-binding transcriptional LysR family regulator
MTDPDTDTRRLTVAYQALLPHVRWGPLFHVYRLEQPDVLLQWLPTGFPTAEGSLLEGADVGLYLEPLPARGLRALTLDTSPMVVIAGAGESLAGGEELSVRDILDTPFPGAPRLDPRWTAFWTLDEQRGGPAPRTDDDVTNMDEALAAIASGRAIGTLPAWVAGGLAHPGVIALPLDDGPQVRTSLVFRTDDERAHVRALVDLATVWTGLGRDGPGLL